MKIEFYGNSKEVKTSEAGLNRKSPEKGVYRGLRVTTRLIEEKLPHRFSSVPFQEASEEASYDALIPYYELLRGEYDLYWSEIWGDLLRSPADSPRSFVHSPNAMPAHLNSVSTHSLFQDSLSFIRKVGIFTGHWIDGFPKKCSFLNANKRNLFGQEIFLSRRHSQRTPAAGWPPLSTHRGREAITGRSNGWRAETFMIGQVPSPSRRAQTHKLVNSWCNTHS